FRGMKNVLSELEVLHREFGVKVTKFYPPGDTAINDPQLWPFWERCEELGIAVSVHTGNGYVFPLGSKYCHPHQLEDVMCDFPELRVIAFHLGYPWYRELAVMVGAFPHLYTTVSALIFRARTSPRWFAEALGEILYWGGAAKTMWSVDWLGQVSYKAMVDVF